MENKEEFLKRRIIDDMSEGVIIMTQGELKNKTIAELISTSDEKDELFELILDVIYTRKKTTKTIPYFCKDEMKYLRITTDFLPGESEKIGVIAQVSDITDATLLFLANSDRRKIAIQRQSHKEHGRICKRISELAC